MNRVLSLSGVCLLALALGANLAQAVVIETVPVADPGNTGELSGEGDVPRVCGSVGYSYYVGKYEVTAAQYTTFLNAVAKTDTYGLYSTDMDTAVNGEGCNIKRSLSPGSYTYSVAPDWANRPVNFVSYWNACRFANWLHNGQPVGPQSLSTTEDGAYWLDGETSERSAEGVVHPREADWKWAVTSEDEWYKAAYYRGGSTNAGYWDYPMQSDIPTVPSNDVAYPDGGNNANFNQSGYTIGGPYYRTNVGEFENSESAYGTFDQGGNVEEWNEAVIVSGELEYHCRGRRGGSVDYGADLLQAGQRGYQWYAYGAAYTGFRVVAVPEPSGLLVLACGVSAVGGMAWRRRKLR